MVACLRAKSSRLFPYVLALITIVMIIMMATAAVVGEIIKAVCLCT
jgi:hypothetical protein